MKAISSKRDSSLSGSVRKLLDAGKSYEEILAFLRSEDVTKLNSIKVLCETADMSLLDAKRLVHNSDAWKDYFDRDERLHASLVRTVTELNLDESPKAQSAKQSVKARS